MLLKRDAIARNFSHPNCTNCSGQDDAKLPGGFHVQSQVPLLVLAVIIVVLNGTIVGLFVKKRSLRSFTNYFLVSLAISDLLTAFLAIPLFLSCNATERKEVCSPSNQFFVFTTLSTICHIAAITADRYVAILHSLRYQELVTKKRVQLATATIWLCCLFMTTIQLSWTVPSEGGPNDISEEDYKKKDLVYTIVFVMLGVIPIPFMVFAYCRVFVQILRQNSLTRQHNRLVENGDEQISCELRTVSMFVLMLLAYIFCLLPHAAFRIEININENLDNFPMYVLQTIVYLCFFTSFLNPCFYGLGKHDFRCVLRELLSTKMFGQKEQAKQNVNVSYKTGCDSVIIL